MTCLSSGTPFEVLPEFRMITACIGRPNLAPIAGFGLAVLALLAGGCDGGGGRNLTPIRGSTDFQRKVLQADKPAMMLFYKGGCGWCSLLAPTLDQLADDYRGRAVFARYYLMNQLWGVTNWELKTRYDIRWYPTVILFVNGQEKKRWVVQYDIKSYRKALDEALSAPKRQAAPVTVAPPPARR